MADGDIIGVPRANQTADQSIESIEADRGGGVRLIQTVAMPCIPGSVVTTGSVNLSNTSATIAAANDQRVALWIYNSSSVFIYIATGTATTSDWPLPPGGFFQDALTTGAWVGIAASSGTHNVRYLEVDLP